MRASFFLAIVAAIVAAGSVIYGANTWNDDPTMGPAAAMFVLLFFGLPALLAAAFFGALGLVLRARAERSRAGADPASGEARKRTMGFWLIRLGLAWAVTAVVANVFFMISLSAIMPGVEGSMTDIPALLFLYAPSLMLKAVPGLLMAAVGYTLDARAVARATTETV